MNLQRFWTRAALRISPSLVRLLNSANRAVTSLEIENSIMRRQIDDRRYMAERELADVEGALAMAGSGPWENPFRESAPHTKLLAPLKERQVQLREGIAELELALEDRGWKRQLALSNMEFSRYGIQQIILISRLYYIKNPLIRRGVQISAYYVFGRGVEVTSKDTKAADILHDFFHDPRNATELAHTALVSKEEALYTDGNLFWALFTSVDDGAVLVRSIDATEIQDIITDPDDASKVQYYHRTYMEMTFNVATGVTTPVPEECWYVALGFKPPPGVTTIAGKPIVKDKKTGEFTPILHKKRGGLPKWRFGCPIVYGAIDWARAYREALEDYCSVKRASTRFAWTIETQGGINAIASFKQTLATTLANNENSIEQNPPPVTGSTFVTGPGSKLTPMKTAGMQDSPEELRRVLLMVCSHFGLPETFFGDASTGSLATAQSLDRPTELKFLETQEDWRETLQTLSLYVLQQSSMGLNGKLRESIRQRLAANDGTLKIDESKELSERVTEATKKTLKNITIEVNFPSILEHDITSRVTAIVDAMTLNGFETTGIDEKTGVKMLLDELGAEDSQEIVDEMYPDEEYDPDRTQQDDVPNTAAPGTPPAPGAAAPPSQDPAQQNGAVPHSPAPRQPHPKRVSPSTSKETAVVLGELRRVLKQIRERGKVAQ